ncbi:9068_t:CDS:2, partial [Gigaspora margarita]
MYRKKILLTTENKCPLSDCNKIINPVVSEQRFSESSSQSSGTSALADRLGKNFGLEKSSNKKAKKVGKKKVSSTLKQLIEELLTNIPIVSRSSEETNYTTDTRGIFLQLSNKIDSAKSKNKDASHALITSYFYFGEALYSRYKELKPTYSKDGAKALVKSKEKIAQVKSIPLGFILNLTVDNTDYVIAKVLKESE